MEYISLNEEYNVLLQSHQTHITQRITYNFIYTKGERRRNWGRGNCSLLKTSFAQKCSVFSGSNLTLCSFHPQAFSEGKKPKRLASFTGPSASEGHRTRKGEVDAVVKRDIATFVCAKEQWWRTSCAEEPGPEQLVCQAPICAALKAAEKLENIQKRTTKRGQWLEMILHEEMELVLLQLLRSVR